MSRNGTATTTKWGCIARSPSKPKPSEYGGYDRIMTVDIDGEGQSVWFKCGGLCDRLQKGDWVVLEFNKGKWRLSKSQTPELLAELEGREPPDDIAAPTLQPPSIVPPSRGSATQQRPPQSSPEPKADDVAEVAEVYNRLARLLPVGTSEAAIVSLTQSVYKYRKERR